MKPLYLSLTNQGERMDSKSVEIDFSKAEIKMKIITDEQSKEIFQEKRRRTNLSGESVCRLIREIWIFLKKRLTLNVISFLPAYIICNTKITRNLSPGLYV
jgi:hypothetical protein